MKLTLIFNIACFILITIYATKVEQNNNNCTLGKKIKNYLFYSGPVSGSVSHPQPQKFVRIESRGHLTERFLLNKIMLQ